MTSTQDTLDVGDIIVIPGTFTNEAGDPFDPDSVSLKVVSPAGVLSVYVAGVDAQIAHDDLGVFEGRVIATADGWWQARWVLAGSEQSQEPVEYYVRPDNTVLPVPAVTPRARVRMWVNDTDPLNQIFTDQTVDAVLADHAGNVLLAAADLCDMLALRYAADIDFETDKQKFTRTKRSAMYAAMATRLRERAAADGDGGDGSPAGLPRWCFPPPCPLIF